MKFSEKGYAALKLLEGFREELYRDLAGHATIGYGHKVKPGDKLDVHTYWDEDTADAALRLDVAPVEKCIDDVVIPLLEQNQFDALVCFAYNIGNNAFTKSTMVKKINGVIPGDAAEEFGRWVFVTDEHGNKVESDGLHNRRQAELDMWQDGIYPQGDDDAADSGSGERDSDQSAGAQEQGGPSGEGHLDGEDQGKKGRSSGAAHKRKASK